MTRYLTSRAAALLAASLFLGSGVAQAPAGFELTLVDVDGQRTVLGELPAAVYAPRVSPDGTRVAFETRDPSSADGARLWTADLTDIAERQPLPLVAGPVNRGADVVARRRTLGVDRVRQRPRRDPLAARGDGTGEVEHLIDTRAGEGWTADGAQLRFLTLTGNGDSHPLWRPDGRSLYFDRDHQLFRLDVNTAGLAAHVTPFRCRSKDSCKRSIGGSSISCRTAGSSSC